MPLILRADPSTSRRTVAYAVICLFAQFDLPHTSTAGHFFLQELEDDEQYRDDEDTQYHPRKHTANGAHTDGVVAECRSAGCPYQWQQTYDECKGGHQNGTKPEL